MVTTVKTQLVTFESVWAALQESNRFLTEKQAETDRILTEKFAATELLFTKHSVEAAIRHKKAEKKMAELKATVRETSKFVRETSKIVSENSKVAKETSKVAKETSKLVGGIANSNGDVAESYFVNSFANHLRFAGQEFDSHSSNLVKSIKKLNLKDQYDLVLYNCNSVVIIEIKYKAKKDDVKQALKKAQTFKQLFPEYANFALYLGLAGLNVEVAAEKEAINQGIAVIKQVGDAIVINDAHLKVF